MPVCGLKQRVLIWTLLAPQAAAELFGDNLTVRVLLCWKYAFVMYHYFSVQVHVGHMVRGIFEDENDSGRWSNLWQDHPVVSLANLRF